MAVVAALVLLAPRPATAQGAMESPTHMMVTADKVTFQPMDVPGFDPGLKLAAVYGDPNAESGFYVVRLAFPAGYKFPAHWHPMAENVTVLEGELMLAMGDKVDPSKLMSYKPGSFLYIAGKNPHFGQVKGATVIQLHGQAPFKIELAKP
jgi:quercetin dioxygenase-like cupin family protein